MFCWNRVVFFLTESLNISFWIKRQLRKTEKENAGRHFWGVDLFAWNFEKGKKKTRPRPNTPGAILSGMLFIVSMRTHKSWVKLAIHKHNDDYKNNLLKLGTNVILLMGTSRSMQVKDVTILSAFGFQRKQIYLPVLQRFVCVWQEQKRNHNFFC